MKKIEKNGSDNFLAVFVEKSITIPGDERSKTNPGHGYPAETVKYNAVIEFPDSEQLRQWIDKNHAAEKYRVVSCRPVYVSVTNLIDFDGI